MRIVLTLLVCLAAGCFPAKDLEVGNIAGDGGAGAVPDPVRNECATDDQCVLAAATCCECPSFAIGNTDPVFGSCGEVTCPPMECATNVKAGCLEHRCVITCAAVACETACPNGYMTDPNGCVTCGCAAAPPPGAGCGVDSDCVEVGADCCGCAQGGVDTAVLVSEVGMYHDRLGCSPNANCPSVNTCQPDALPRCIQGQCELSTASAVPTDACGRPDLPLCPADQHCIVNSNDTASMLGLGVCGAL